MKTSIDFFYERFLTYLLLFGMLFCSEGLYASSVGQLKAQSDSTGFVLYKGKVMDHKSGNPLAFASIMLKGSNISTITNSEGAFSIKIPLNLLNGNLMVTFLGYRNKISPISSLDPESSIFKLDELTVMLPEISVVFSDATSLILAVLEKKKDNYQNNSASMTAFYRETIKKRKTYVSLLEAVVNVNRSPYTSTREDVASLYKARKSTDYQKLDTLIFKLMGGPYNTLHADVMKYTDDIFDKSMMNSYEFSFDQATRIDDRLIYVVDFKPLSYISEPMYYGKLYIDSESLTMISAVSSLTLDNRDAVSAIFIKKRPLNAKVYPTKFNVRADYLQKDGRWYLGYSRVELDIHIDWKRKLFNTNYGSVMEMAVTDWAFPEEGEKLSIPKEHLRPSTVISDEAEGFADPAFWGDYNVIEPEKSIESAIKKIQKQLKKQH
ncbi:MAG: carboxypeptidase-like regulatory domain-containing protein [Bacteroidales bacterium]|nr:carboxypeptidase-like regulatory domain-containing protein [Bacteroidales bacterium]MDD4712421.1 carboxypeptidase-like regulatory domain-containing protein [Bacteroidales bacterium]